MYCFLAASLPELAIGTPAPITLQDFDDAAAMILSEADCRLLASVSGDEELVEKCRIYREMKAFELYLRDRIARKRAEKNNISFTAPEPDGDYCDADHTVAEAALCTDPLAREELIDKLRWAKLDELNLENKLNFDALCIYRLKLAIVNKYVPFSSGKGAVNFTGVLEKIVNGTPFSVAKEI